MVDAGVAMGEARPFYFSVFAFAPGEIAVTGVMLVTALALVMLLLGVQARAAALWVFIWHLSYIGAIPAGAGRLGPRSPVFFLPGACEPAGSLLDTAGPASAAWPPPAFQDTA